MSIRSAFHLLIIHMFFRCYNSTLFSFLLQMIESASEEASAKLQGISADQKVIASNLDLWKQYLKKVESFAQVSP